MKKLLGILFVAILLVGCNATNEEQPKTGDEENVEKDKEQQALSMQVLKADEENGVTLENEMYQQLSGLVEENPEIGVADDFSIHGIDLVKTSAGESVMLFLGINRLEKGIKDITLEYTLGVETEGTVKYVFDREEINLLEPFAGVIQPNHAVPFTVPVTAEGEKLLQLMTDENKTAKIENAKFELEK
ncbi:hypothetical protein MKY34_09850 [Sporosarcina sp. FSL K6-1522]|uniref:hypothetical protein n=1 Tax=Sporosarcina sp. FSL K6-1522 TaxID=2921554 RepID=UPI00315AAB39